MNYKRPCLLMAVVFVLGEGIASNELGLLIKCLLAGSLLLFCLVGFIKKGLSRGAAALLLVLFAAGVMRYCWEAKRLSVFETEAARFGEMQVQLEGVVEQCELPAVPSGAMGDGQQELQTKITVTEAVLSSAYGDPDHLPANVSEKLRQRYNRPAGRVLIYLEGVREVYPGQNIRCVGNMIQSKPPTNEGMFDFGLYYRSLGVSGRMGGKQLTVTGGSVQPYAGWIQKIKTGLKGILQKICVPGDAGLYQAILLGEKSELDQTLMQLFQDNGISHIMAVSGLHLSIIGMGFYELLKRIGLSRTPGACASTILVISYGILTGASGSALRAVIMLLLRFLAELSGRDYDMLSAVGVAAMLLLWRSPYLLVTSGFQLSFMAVISLSLASELWRPKQSLISSLYSSAALQLGTLPVVLFHFFQFPLYGILLNLVVIPLMTYVVYSGLAGIGAYLLLTCLHGAPSAGGWITDLLLGGGHYILQFYIWISGRVSRLPYARLVLGRPKQMQIFLYYLLLAAVYIALNVWKRREGRVWWEQLRLWLWRNTWSRRICCLLEDLERWGRAGARERKSTGRLQVSEIRRSFAKGLVVVFAVGIGLIFPIWVLIPSSQSGLEVTFLDVGQGDGIVIRQDGYVVTMDMGSSSNKKLGENVIEPYLKSQGIGRIDAAMISHSDADHTSGLLYLLEEVDSIVVQRLILPGPARGDTRYDSLRQAAEMSGTQVLYMGAGDMLKWGETSMVCYYPPGDAGEIEDPNQHSTAVHLNYGSFDLLLTGDMDAACEEQMLACVEGDSGREADGLRELEVLKVGHHGSKTSTSEALLHYMRPRYGVLSYGKGNSYGHPSTEVTERLETYGVTQMRTGESGQLRVTTDGSEMEWESYIDASQ